MSSGLIIPENLMALADAFASAGSEASASMADDNLLTEEPSEFWRSSSNLQSKAWFAAGNTFLSRPGVSAFALASHNLMRGDQYRFMCTTGSIGALGQGYSYWNPNGTVAALCSNIADTANSHLLVDNGETSPGATWLTGTSANWSIGLDFYTPSDGNPVAGTDKQAIWVYAKGSQVNPPGSIRVEIYEGTTLKETSRTYYVGSLTGQWLCFPWDAKNLSDATGAGIRAKLVVTGPATISVGSVTLAVDFTTSVLYDSGWLTYNPYVAGSGINLLPHSLTQGNSILHLPGQLISPKYTYVQIRANNSPPALDNVIELLPTPSGFAQVGCMVMGEKWSPATDRGHGPYLGVTDLSSKGITDGGQVFGSRRPTLRTLSWPLTVLSKIEGDVVIGRIVRRHGVLKKFFVHLAPGDSVENESAGFMATLKNAEHMMATSPAKEGNRAITLEFVEAL